MITHSLTVANARQESFRVEAAQRRLLADLQPGGLVERIASAATNVRNAVTAPAPASSSVLR
jgi:hypothetical protein